MRTTQDQRGAALAEVRARTALRDAGLDPAAPLIRASSVTNEVWLSPTHAVRVNRHPSNRLYRESLVAAVLPSAVGYPRIAAHGGGRGEDWLVLERVPGEPLAACWPDLSEAQREDAIHQLAARLAAMHRTPAPAGLPPIDQAPQLLDVGVPHPTARLLAALDQAAALDHVDPLLMIEAADMVRRLAPSLQPFESTTLVHGDVTFENVLWHDGEVTALLDMEWARPGPADLDLDILLRCAAYPQLHVAPALEARTRPEDYVEVPWWLGRSYPKLFDYPSQLDRMCVYSIAYDTRDLLAAPPQRSPRHLPELHAYHRLAAVVHRKSYLDILGKGRI